MASRQLPSKLPLSCGSQECFDYFCEPCSKEGKHIEAYVHCQDCRECLCSECFRVHKNLSALRDHIFLDKSELTKTKPPSERQDFVTARCHKHPSKPLEYFCTVDETLACNACIVLDHRNCDPIQFIPDVSVDFASSFEYQELNKNIDGMLIKATQVSECAKKNAAEANDVCSSAKEDMKTFRKDMETLLELSEKNMAEQVDNIYKADQDRMEEIEDTITTAATKIENIQAEVNILLKNKSHCELFVTVINAKETVKRLQDMVDDLEVDNHITHYKFQPSDEIKEIIDGHKFLGSLKQEISKVRGKKESKQLIKSRKLAYKEDAPTKPVATKPSGDYDVTAKEPAKLTASHLDDICIKMPTDSLKCSVTGIVTVGEKLVVVDNTNRKLKLVDPDKQEVLSDLKLPSCPWDVTRTDQNHVAVTVPLKNKIMFLKLSMEKVLFLKFTQKLSIQSEVDVAGQCYGINHMNGKLFVTYKSPPKVEILDFAGKVLHTIDEDGLGRKIFLAPEYVTVEPDGQVLYISDVKAVKRVTYDGVVEEVYSSSDLGEPNQLVINPNGSVFTCSRRLNNIHVISPKCERVQILLDQNEGLWSPQALDKNIYTGRLYVGSRNDNNIKVFQLS